MIKDPKVSVIITTHNRPKMLQRSVDSVLSQTFTDLELIIVDDCSDVAPKVNLPKGEDRVIPIRMPWNTGFHMRPKNVGIMCARAEVICYLDDDNEFLPNHVEVLYDALKYHNADVVYGDRIYKSTNPNEKRFMGKMSVDWDPKKIERDNFVDTSDIMHTLSSIEEVGYWGIFWKKKPDWLLMKKFADANKKVIHVSEDLTIYHWHDTNYSALFDMQGKPIKK